MLEGILEPLGEEELGIFDPLGEEGAIDGVDEGILYALGEEGFMVGIFDALGEDAGLDEEPGILDPLGDDGIDEGGRDGICEALETMDPDPDGCLDDLLGCVGALEEPDGVVDVLPAGGEPGYPPAPDDVAGGAPLDIVGGEPGPPFVFVLDPE